MDAKIHHLFVFYKVDKEKVSDWFGIADLFRPIHTNNPKLDSAAKVIKDFQKPSIEGGINCKIQKCNFLIFNLLQNLPLHFFAKGLKMGRFDGLFWSESRVFFVYWILLLSGKRV